MSFSVFQNNESNHFRPVSQIYYNTFPFLAKNLNLPVPVNFGKYLSPLSGVNTERNANSDGEKGAQISVVAKKILTQG